MFDFDNPFDNTSNWTRQDKAARFRQKHEALNNCLHAIQGFLNRKGTVEQFRAAVLGMRKIADEIRDERLRVPLDERKSGQDDFLFNSEWDKEIASLIGSIGHEDQFLDELRSLAGQQMNFDRNHTRLLVRLAAGRF